MSGTNSRTDRHRLTYRADFRLGYRRLGAFLLRFLPGAAAPPFPRHRTLLSARCSSVRNGISNASAIATSCSKSRLGSPASTWTIAASDIPLRRARSAHVRLRRTLRARTAAPKARTNAVELLCGIRGGDIGTQQGSKQRRS
jgi:hypothetical protein